MVIKMNLSLQQRESLEKFLASSENQNPYFAGKKNAGSEKEKQFAWITHHTKSPHKPNTHCMTVRVPDFHKSGKGPESRISGKFLSALFESVGIK